MRGLLLVAIVLVGGGLIAYATARVLGLRPKGGRRWLPTERVDEDGTLRVGVARGEEFREVRAIPRGDDEIDVLADVRIAKRDAADLADELNRS